MNSDISKVVSVAFTPLARDLNNSQKAQVDSKATEKVAKSDKLDQDATEKSGSETKVTSLEDARKLAEEGNKILENVQRNLQFKIDDSTKQVVMSIVDKKTGEVIKQIPSEEVLEMAQRLQESGGEGAIVQGRA
ncbi:MAG: flagellar protein FlaG [Methyloprofundus sp.]|nr:MAG: flagellar protein FlaG [Methyloprofundus sp.]